MAQGGIRFLQPVFEEYGVEYGTIFSAAPTIGSEEMTSLAYDFYEPVGDTMSRRPLVITVFGGAFVAGNRSWADMVAYAKSLCRYGYTVASIDYRLLPILHLSEMNFIRTAYAAAQDLSAAVRYFKGNADTYRIDTNQIFVLGNSAGTVTAMHFLWLDEDERPEETFAHEGFLGFGDREDLGPLHSSGYAEYLSHTPDVAGVIAHWGAVLDTSIIDSDENTPVCLIHGTNDESLPFAYGTPYGSHFFGISSLVLPDTYGSYYIDQRLTNVGVTHEMHIFEGEPHCFYLDDSYQLIPEKFDTCLSITLAFLAQYNTHIALPNAITENTGNGISIYPNPANALVQCNLQNATDEILITDMSGRLVKKITAAEITGNTVTLDVSDWTAGVYFLHFHEGEKVLTEKLVVK